MRANLGLTIKVDKGPDANLIREAAESDEAQTPAEFINNSKRVR